MWPRSSTKSSMPCEKTDPRVQGEARQGRAEGVPVADVGLPPRSGELDTRGAAGAGECVRADPEAEGVVPGSAAVQGDLRYSPRPDHGGALVEGTPPRGRTVGAGPRRVLRDVRSVEDGDPELLRCAPDECLGGGDQHQGAGDHQAGVWAEVGRQPVDAPDPGPESGVGGDRLVDRGDPPDGPRAEGPFRPISRLITEEPNAWGAAWAGAMTRALVDASALLAVVLAVWLPLRRRMSAQLAHGLFCLVLLRLAVPQPLPWPSWLPSVSVREAVGRAAAWVRPAEAPPPEAVPAAVPS